MRWTAQQASRPATKTGGKDALKTAHDQPARSRLQRVLASHAREWIAKVSAVERLTGSQAQRLRGSGGFAGLGVASG